MYSLLTATLEGIPVIRAFQKQNSFLSDYYNFINSHTSAWFLYLASIRFLALSIDMIAVVFGCVYMVISILIISKGEYPINLMYNLTCKNSECTHSRTFSIHRVTGECCMHLEGYIQSQSSHLRIDYCDQRLF